MYNVYQTSHILEPLFSTSVSWVDVNDDNEKQVTRALASEPSLVDTSLYVLTISSHAPTFPSRSCFVPDRTLNGLQLVFQFLLRILVILVQMLL